MSQLFYADSSSLVKLHVREIGSDWMKGLVAPTAENKFITSTLTIVEVISSFNRHQSELFITHSEYSQIA